MNERISELASDRVNERRKVGELVSTLVNEQLSECVSECESPTEVTDEREKQAYRVRQAQVQKGKHIVRKQDKILKLRIRHLCCVSSFGDD